jgi:hypothetical protein
MRGLKDFRDAVRQEGERSPVPSLSSILARERPRGVSWTWVAASAAVVLTLFAVPYYVSYQTEREKQAAQDRADAELMLRVNTALSRSVPLALEPLMGGTQCEPKSC